MSSVDDFLKRNKDAKRCAKFTPHQKELFELRDSGITVSLIALYLVEEKGMELVAPLPGRKRDSLNNKQFTEKTLGVWLSQNYRKHIRQKTRDVYIVSSSKHIHQTEPITKKSTIKSKPKMADDASEKPGVKTENKSADLAVNFSKKVQEKTRDENKKNIRPKAVKPSDSKAVSWSTPTE